jgi:hypothetical protein
VDYQLPSTNSHFCYLPAHSGWIDRPCLTPLNAANIFQVKGCLFRDPALQLGGILIGETGGRSMDEHDSKRFLDG